MTNSSHASTTLMPHVETRADRLTAMRNTVLRCMGALGGNTDPTSHLVCEALQQVTDELGEMIVDDAKMNSAPRRYRNVEERLVDIEDLET